MQDPWRRQFVYREVTEARKAARRALIVDICVWLFSAIGIAAVVWGLWRLDDRNERLFSVVATERACVCR